MDGLSNRIIKGYEFKERVGTGGFGAVYRAYQPVVGREVAIKVILPQHANQPDFIRRFEVEAQLIARLEHPHIVPLYDYWREPDGAFLVMRWLRGSLHGGVQRGHWSVERISRLLDQIAGALTVAHREGVIHRDIKPDNILLDEDDNAYLADFGIAKNLNIGVGVAESGITQDSAIVGSPAYITPEQINGDTVTPRTDIYSLGLVLYEMLVGEKPYSDVRTPYELIAHQLNTPIPALHIRRPNLPAALNEVLQTATPKDPAQRYANALRFAAAFRAALPNLQRAPAQPLPEPLTERERDIIRLMIDGLSNAEIAERLVLSAATVKWYVQQLYGKLDVHSRRQAVDRAKQMNLDAHTPMPAVLNRDRLESQTVVESTQGLVSPALHLVTPYKGLRAFQEADAADFFGRAALTEQLLARLAESGDGARFLAVVGPSGSGKSSVVRAGLIPALRRRGLPHSDRWFITEMLPGTHPLEELEVALLRVAASPQTGLLSQLSEDRRGLVRAAKHILPADQDTELVLVIDQFEELFTLLEDEAVRGHFIDNLLSAATDPRSRVRIILTLRADFYDRPLLYPRLAELMRSHTEIILPFSLDELERAIAGPAERVGLTLEAGLVGAIVHDVGEQPGTLPLLQYALSELYERRTDRTLTREAYRASGGIRGALARRANELYDDLETASQAAVRQLFLRLITLGEGTEDTRRRALLTELEGLDAPALEEVINAFVQYRLLTLDRDPMTRGPTVEIAHEALIREWARLRDWLTEGREDLRIQRRLLSAAAEWKQAGRDPSFLATGARLAQFEALQAGSDLALTDDECVYLTTSITERERIKMETQAQHSRELKLAQQSAENAKQAAANAHKAAHSQHQSANRLRYLVGALGMFLLIAVGLSTFAFSQRADAVSQKQSAQNSAATALANYNVANGQSLAAAANALLPGSTNNAEEAALLAIRSLQTGYSTQADLALQRANDLLFTQNIWRNTPSSVQILAYAPDGKMLLIAGTNGLELCNMAPDCHIRRLLIGSLGFSAARFLPDGRDLIGVNWRGQIEIWDVATGTPERQFYAETATQGSVYDYVITDFQLSADGKYMLFGESSLSAGEIEVGLWDIAAAKQLNHWKLLGSAGALAFSPDGQYIVMSNNFNAELWRLDGTAPLRKLIGKTFIQSLAVSPDSRLIVTGGMDGTAQLWDAASGQAVHTLIGHSGPIMDVLFSPDGKYVLTTSIDKTARIWDTVTGSEVRRLTGHRDAVYAASYSPDGAHIVTSSIDGDVRFWSTDLSQTPGKLATEAGQLSNLSVSSDGTRLFTTNQTHNNGTLWRSAPLQPIQTVPGAAAVSQFSTNGLIATVSNPTSGDATVVLLNGSDGRTLNTFTIPIQQGSPNGQDTALSPDGQLVAPIGFDSKAVHIYNAATGQEVRKIHTGITDWPTVGRFSADGKFLLIGLGDGHARLWDISTGKPVMSFDNGTDNNSTFVFSVGFSPDGRYVAVGRSGDVVLYDRTTGARLQTLTRSSSGAVRAEFSPDGKQVVIGGYNAGLDLWDAATGKQLRTFVGHTGPSYGVFSPDGKVIYSVGFEGAIRQWYTDYHDLITAVCGRIFRDFEPADRITYNITGQNPTCPTNPVPTIPVP